MKVSVIVQARTGSTRLPGKVLLPLGGRPLLASVLEALLAAQTVAEVIVAVPERDLDALGPIVTAAGCAIVGGSEDDVLSRYEKAARTARCATIVRATADNPLVCPELLDEIVGRHFAEGADLSHYLGIPPGSGVEVVSAVALFAAAAEAVLPYEREHVTPFIYAHRERFIVREPDLGLDPGLRLTVDTQDDYARVAAILERMGTARPITLRRLLELYRQDAAVFR